MPPSLNRLRRSAERSARITALCLVSALCAGAPAATAADPVAPKAAAKGKTAAKPMAPKVPEVVLAMLTKGQNVKLLDTFAVTPQLTAYVLLAGDERRIYYVTADGKYAILGLLFDEKLDNLTAEHLRRYPVTPARVATGPGPEVAPMPAPALTPSPDGVSDQQVPPAAAAALLNVARAAAAANIGQSVVSEGKGIDVFVIYDPTCPYCKQLYKLTRSMLDRVRLHWLPVAALGPRSQLMAEALLTAPNRAQALEAVVNDALPPATQMSSAVGTLVTANYRMLQAAGIRSVPTLVLQDQGQARVIVGLPAPGVLEQVFAHAAAGSGTAAR